MKFNKILILSILCLLLNSYELLGQSNEIPNTSNSENMYIGISPFINKGLLPETSTNIMTNENDIKYNDWKGQGILFEFMFNPSLLHINSNNRGKYFASMNTSIGIIKWNSQTIEYKNGEKYERKINKGYSYVLIPAIRLHSSTLNQSLGAFISGGWGFTYNTYKNVDSFENTNYSLKYGFSFGAGAYVSLPFDHPILIELSLNWVLFYNNNNFGDNYNLRTTKIAIYYQMF
jgi:hypothetical protein